MQAEAGKSQILHHALERRPASRVNCSRISLQPNKWLRRPSVPRQALLFCGRELHRCCLDNRLPHVPGRRNVLEGNFKFAMISGRNRWARRTK